MTPQDVAKIIIALTDALDAANAKLAALGDLVEAGRHFGDGTLSIGEVLAIIEEVQP